MLISRTFAEHLHFGYMIIIGITGTLGAGKGTIVEYLTGQRNFVHYSVRAFIAEELTRRELPVNRDNLTHVANELRFNHSPSYITDQLFERALLSGQNCVIESIRTPGEITSLREKGRFILFAVDADPEVRYRRIYLRKSETDDISFNTFIANEKREFTSSDPNKQNLKKCIEMADVVFNNNGTKMELFTNVEATLNGLKI